MNQCSQWGEINRQASCSQTALDEMWHAGEEWRGFSGRRRQVDLGEEEISPATIHDTFVLSEGIPAFHFYSDLFYF